MNIRLEPQDVFDELRKTVMGQDDALREVAVAVVKHLLGHSAGNILLIGNSGSGKTTLMRAVEQFLSSRTELSHASNVIRINANVLADETGGYGGAVLSRLYQNAFKKLGPSSTIDDRVKWVERGIVFIDEVDKVRSHVGEKPNVRGIVAQEALLTLMENENVEFPIEKPIKATLSVNSSSILFVAGGAFEELYDRVYRRALIGADSAPLKPVVVVSSSGDLREEIPFHLRDWFRYEDIFDYGMTPQFVSRFESTVVLNDLGETDLARIFIEPQGSIFRTSRDYFAQFDIDLQITRGAVVMIAWEASRQKRLGARALKDIYRRIVRQLEFNPLAAVRKPVSSGEPQVVTIDEEMVKKVLHPKEQGTAKVR